MKRIKLQTILIDHLDQQPQILVVGVNEQLKLKLMTFLLSSSQFYSKKYGRIIYIGERKYKSEKIVHDEKNTFERINYKDLMDKIDDAKKDEIKNLLIVFNTKNIHQYTQIIQKLLAVRLNYLRGIISLMVNLGSLKDFKKQIIDSFNTFFTFEDEKQIRLKNQINQPETKRKKDCYVISQGKITVYRQIKD